MTFQGGLVYPELSYTINGILFSSHNQIGRYGKEKQYADAIEEICIVKKIYYIREKEIGNSRNRIDFIIDGKILLELKAKRLVTKEDYEQTQRYLQETQLKLGLLVNFRDAYIKPKRIVRIDTEQKQKFLS